MGSSQNRKLAIKKLKLLVYNSKSDVNVFRSKIEETFYTPFLPNHVECSEHIYGGVKCDVLAPEVYSSKRVMLYIHGGSFVGGSRRSWRGFCSMLANKTFSRVVVPEFRLAPAHAFPLAIEDIQNTFRALFTEEQIARSLDSGSVNDLPEIIIAADSSGASIAMALLLNLRERFRKSISKVILFSPWLNLSESSYLKSGKKLSDEVMTSDCLKMSGDVYTYSSNLSNYLVSPINSSKELLSGLPPFFIQMGEKEILLEDVKSFCSLLEECNVPCTLDVWPNMIHLFQMADEFFPEAHEALNRISFEITNITKKETSRQCFENKPRLENGVKAEA